MSKRFRSWDVDQTMLLPPSVRDFVPENHTAHFVRELARTELDLREIEGTYGRKGYPAYHPRMMVALLLYAYTRGVFSSRKIARACEERMDFVAVTGMQKPDFRTISDFRKRHLKAMEGLFQQTADDGATDSEGVAQDEPGCGCASSPHGDGRSLLLLAPLLLLRARRRRLA